MALLSVSSRLSHLTVTDRALVSFSKYCSMFQSDFSAAELSQTDLDTSHLMINTGKLIASLVEYCTLIVSYRNRLSRSIKCTNVFLN